MRFEIEDHDLYPPDAEDIEVTKEAKQHRFRVAVGACLLVWGTSLLVNRSIGLDLDTGVLGLGVGALAGWSQLRRYGWFVAGAIGVGLGLSDVSDSILHGAFGDGISSFLVAAGFAAVYVRYPRRSKWALVVAGIMALVGVAAFGIGLLGLIPMVFGRFLLPLLLVSGGALLLFRHSLPPRTVKIGLAAIVATFVLVGANSVPEVDHNPPPQVVIGGLPKSMTATSLGIMPGQTLVMAGGGSGKIEFRPATAAMPGGGVEVGGRARPLFTAISHDGDRLIVGSGKPGFGQGDSRDYVVYVPEGVNLEIERGSGDISGTLAGVSGTITTHSGAIDLRLQDGGDEGIAGDGPLKVVAGSGDVSITSALALDLRALSDGDLTVNGRDYDRAYTSTDGTKGVDVRVTTDSGSIDVEMPGAKDTSGSSTVPTSSAPSTTAG